jgi:5-methyltetrahydrofolate--homocysteine methyltransferase
MEMKIEEIKEAVWQLKKDKALALVKEALEEGLDPVEILQAGVIAGLQVVGQKFGAKEYFLAELVMGGKVAEPCIELITPHLPESAEGRPGTVVIGAESKETSTRSAMAWSRRNWSWRALRFINWASISPA